MKITNIRDKVNPHLNYQNISMFIPPLKTILNELQGFTEYIQIALEDAIREATDYFDSNKLPRDIYLLNDLIRYHTKRVMKAKANTDLFEDYKVDDKLANNGLACRYAGYFIKVFKDRKDGMLIPNSDTKEAFFCQQLSFDDSDVSSLELSRRPNVFYTWNIDEDFVLMPLRFVCLKSGVKNKGITEVYYDEIIGSIIESNLGKSEQAEQMEFGDLGFSKKGERIEDKGLRENDIR